MRSQKMKVALTALTALIALTAFTSTASAGAYKVYSCKLPSGQPAPIDGWTHLADLSFSSHTNNCGSGGALTFGLSNHQAWGVGTSMRWGFNPGGNRRIIAWDVWRSGSANGGSAGPGAAALTYTYSSSTSAGTQNYDYCADFQGCHAIGSLAAGAADSNKRSADALAVPVNTNAWYVHGTCGGTPGYSCNASASTLVSGQIHRADFTIEDNGLPAATTPTGSLIGTGTHSGTEGVQFTASDTDWANTGSGVYRAVIEVDNQVVNSTIPNDNGGKCSPVGADSTYNDFTMIQPCPQSTPVSLEFNTSAVTDGTHSLRIRVLDAAGNGSTVYGPSNFSVKNAPDPIAPNPGGPGGNNGSGGNLTTAKFSSTSAKGNLIRTKYGRTVNLATRLTDAAGEPITGAQVDVFEFVNVAGATEHRGTSLMSDAQGWVNYRPKTTSNKLVTFKWAATRGASEYRASDATTLIVAGSLRMKAKKRKLRSRGKLNLTGKVYGEDMPRSVPVQIQAKQGKKWRVIAIVNTKRNGTFKYSYRFKFTAHGKFTFRSVVRASSDLSVEPSRSKAVKVKVG